MKHTRRVKVTTLQCRIYRPPPANRAHCLVCAREVETLAPDQAAAILGIEEQRLDGLIATGIVHALRTVSDSRRICQASLFVQGGGQ
jgi:hypothetical protein